VAPQSTVISATVLNSSGTIMLITFAGALTSEQIWNVDFIIVNDDRNSACWNLLQYSSALKYPLCCTTPSTDGVRVYLILEIEHRFKLQNPSKTWRITYLFQFVFAVCQFIISGTLLA
jgi:hypothetical protein